MVSGRDLFRVHLQPGESQSAVAPLLPFACYLSCWYGILILTCVTPSQRPFKAHSHEKLAKEVTTGKMEFPITQPPVSMDCVNAMSALLNRDRKARPGAIEFSTFTQHPFFKSIDFEALEAKKIEPIFIPSSEKTNFDATYDLEELLLEEAPLEARARRQRPREQLKGDASDKEIRADELHRMIESLFEPFDYTTVSYDSLFSVCNVPGDY